MSGTITHGLTNHRLYTIWRGMRARCNNPKAFKYEIYGGAGIMVCSAWDSDFYEFYKWAMAHGYAEGLTIDRINSKQDYAPYNCRFVTRNVQNRNRNSYKNSSSKYVGVSVQRHCPQLRYVATIRIKGKTKYLGFSLNEDDAAQIREDFILRNGLEREGYKLNFA